MLLSMVTLCAALLAAQESASASPSFTSRVTLQVRAESGESASSVNSYLAMPDLLGSIAANLVAPGSESYAGPDRVQVAVSATGSEMLVIRAAGTDRAAVDAAVGRILDHLKRIEPGRYRERRDVVERARSTVAAAETALTLARRQQQEFVQRHGAIDPSGRVGLLQSFVANRTGEVGQGEMNVAEMQARVDYMKAQLARTPPTVDERKDVKNGETSALAQQVEQLERRYAEIVVARGEEHAETKDLAAKLDQVRTLLAERGSVVVRSPNPRYLDVEHDLFKLEYELARDVTRLEVLKQMLRDYEKEVATLTLVASEYAQIWRAVEQGQIDLVEARRELRNAERGASGLADGWFVVVAGPTMQG